MNTSGSILQQLHIAELDQKGIQLFVKRDDLIHPIISGNKWRKLKYGIQIARSKGCDGLLTFGGAYSNHLVATAAACNELGLSAVGIVRGDELSPESNQTLNKCQELGMTLVFVDRMTYSLKDEKAYLEELLLSCPNHHIVPEGGADYYGMIGCQEILNEVDEDFDQIWLACGTGTTAAGLSTGVTGDAELHVVPVLKGFEVENTIRELLFKSAYDEEFILECLGRIKSHTDYHFGGYAKYTDELLQFIKEFYNDYGIPLDPVYTGKAMFALMDTVKKDALEDCKILFIHTGGLQGAASIQKESGISLYGN